MINRKFFIDRVRLDLFQGGLKPSAQAGLEGILDEWELNNGKEDDRWLAYMLATTHHETDRKMQPIEEYGRGKGRPYGVRDAQTGQIYYGRGFVQLTWKANYRAMSAVCGVDLVADASLALDPANATKILFYGMIQGSFTTKKLADYFNPTKDDWVNARRIINGVDKANAIAAYGRQYYAAISYTTP